MKVLISIGGLFLLSSLLPYQCARELCQLQVSALVYTHVPALKWMTLKRHCLCHFLDSLPPKLCVLERRQPLTSHWRSLPSQRSARYHLYLGQVVSLVTAVVNLETGGHHQLL